VLAASSPFQFLGIISIERRLEAELGPVYQHTQIVAVHVKALADLGFVGLFEKYAPQDLLVLLGKLGQNLADQIPALARHHLLLRADTAIRQILRGIREGRVTRGSAEHLHHYIDADRVNVGAEPLRVVQGPVRAKKVEHAQERLLPDVLDELPGAQAAAQPEKDDVVEVSDEMLLGLPVSRPELR